MLQFWSITSQHVDESTLNNLELITARQAIGTIEGFGSWKAI
jgi:hypothetical protein